MQKLGSIIALIALTITLSIGTAQAQHQTPPETAVYHGDHGPNGGYGPYGPRGGWGCCGW